MSRLLCLLLFFVPQALPDNPLPPCPSAPSCVRESRHFDDVPDVLRRRVRQALDEMGASEVESQDGGRLHAVFRVVLFKDDVDVMVTPHDGGAVLHVRSASRVGSYDFGVNRRRVARFFRTVEDAGGT